MNVFVPSHWVDMETRLSKLDDPKPTPSLKSSFSLAD
jgi:hypothetical protein